MSDSSVGNENQVRGQNALQRRALQLKRWHELDKEEDKEGLKRERKTRVRFRAETLFLSSVVQNDLEEAERLLRESSERVDVNVTSNDGLTALHQMAIDDNLQMCRWLLKKGANVNSRDNEGWTPLHAAASCGHVEIVRLLVQEEDCDVFAVNCDQELARDVCDGDECLELIQAAMRRRLRVSEIAEEVLEELRAQEVKKIEEDLKNFFLNRVVSDETCEEYLEATRDQASRATVLHVCAAKGYERVLKLILDLMGDHVTSKVDLKRDQDGFTCLHAAAFWRQITCFEQLLAAGANPDLKTEDGRDLSDLCHENQKILDLAAESRRKSEQLQKSPLPTTTAETQRKMNARRQRETRRPTQGVTKEEIEMAMKEITNNSEVEPPGQQTPPPSQPPPPPMPSSPPPVAVFTLPQPRDHSPKEPTTAAHDANHVTTTVTLNPPLRRRQKRRSTGIGDTLTTLTNDDDDTAEDEVSSSVVRSPFKESISTPPTTTSTPPTASDQRSRSSSRQSSIGSVGTTDSEPTTPTPTTTTTDRRRALDDKDVDYRQLWREVSKENEFLVKKVKELEEKKNQIQEFQREKRQLMRRIGELEEELKTKEELMKENQRLKEENSALIRVISKLSK